MVKEAFIESQHCVVTQLTAHLNIPKEILENKLDFIHDNWRMEGVNPRDLIELAKLLDRSCYILGENRLLLKFESESREKAICAMCALNHFYLYSNAQFACHVKENALEKVMPHQSILKDVASKK